MIRAYFLTAIAGLTLVASAPAQSAAWRFQWQAGQMLTYRVEHVTSSTEEIAGKKTETKAKLNHIKRWRVLEVDGKGVATLQLSLTALRLETTTPTGEVLLFDSTDLAKSDPQMREQLSKFVGEPLAVLRVDGKGKVVEVRDNKHGSAARYESEPPFVLTLPEESPTEGQTWKRAYAVTLEPPHGSGEHYNAVQRYECQRIQWGSAILSLKTGLQPPPSTPLEQLPLLQAQPEGEVIFDLKAGRLQSARLSINKELKGHQGEGSRYRFQSSYKEELVESK